MIAGSIGRRYAKALLSIGVATHSFDALGRELDRAAETIASSAELKNVLENPVFPLSQRHHVLEDVAQRLSLSASVKNLLLILLDRGRISVLPDIARAHRELVDEQAGRARATITSAAPLDPAIESRLRGALEKHTGKTVLLDKKVDPSLIGGVVAQVGDLVFDGSVKHQLEELRTELLSE
ncbi:MAG: ATP synthase F1 subunit delta [Polyangia bacterium]